MGSNQTENIVYTVSDGELVLTLEVLSKEDGGGFGVTSPMEPALITEADSLEGAFLMARDAIETLKEAREAREENWHGTKVCYALPNTDEAQ